MTQPTERRFVMEPRLDAEVETLNTAIEAEETARIAADALKVAKAGDTMTGALVLPGNPTSNLQAAPKQYVDTQDALKVAKAGDTMTGALVLPADPTLALQAATKQYVDNAVATGETSGSRTIAVKNGASSLTKGQPVYISGANGTNIIISAAGNGSEATSSKTIGLVTTALSANAMGVVITNGLLSGLDTSGAGAAGDPVWLGPSGTLLYGISAKPVAPAHLVYIGIVTKKNASTGEILVNPQNGFEIDELHNVLITSPTDGQILKYNYASSLWVNGTAASGALPAGGATGKSLIKNSGTDYDASWSTLGVVGGGTGATSLTSGGYLKGAGTSAITSQTGIPATDITSGALAIARGGTGVTTGAGLVPIIPTSITTSSGSASFNSTTGLITLTGSGDAIINGIFSSTYNFYRIVFNMPFSGNSNVSSVIYFRFASGGSTNGSSNYTYTNWYTQSGVNGNLNGTGTGTNWGICGYAKDAVFEIGQPANASTGTSLSFVGTYNHTIMIGQAGYNANAAFDGIQFANNFYTGTLKVYGYN